ncbi:protein wings apart-like isoform X2 [Daphnia carinata]|uniref:protein wings apart-like isoform X2 n=1 Tax=Daphnia carinata TaxID=120202 RepID=UPI0028684AEE|nr:protein wings apart-like isoform X2 [Daphnia carinata]
MSKHNKTYGKRGVSAPVASIQFDKIIADSNKRPTASKSAGVVGKWGTTSFTSLRSSQVNGSKAGKRGMSPIKCIPVEYGLASHTSTALNTGLDAFNFETGVNTTTNCTAQPKPRKFFKSRAVEDVTKNPSNVQNSSQSSNCIDYPSNHGEILGNTNFYPASSGGVGYLSPTYTSPTSKITTKRGRGRPKGARVSSPRGSAAVTSYKPNPGRGVAPRGRRRVKNNRSVRGQQSSGRGKRKRAKWEGESESEEEEVEEEEDAANSELEEPLTLVREADLEEEEEIQEEEKMERNNGVENLNDSKEECKPPIKLRIIRRNDTNAFVSKVGTEADKVTSEIATPPVIEMPKEEVSLPVECPEKVFNVPVEEKMAISPEVPTKRESPEHCPSIEEEETFQKPVIPEDVITVHKEEIASIDASVVPPPAVQHHQRKSSIFKSRGISTQPPVDKNSLVKGESSVAAKGKKGLALYRHTWHEDDARKAASAESDGVSAAAALSSSAGLSPEEQQRPHSSPWDELGDEPEGPPPKLARLGALSSNSLSSVPQKLAHSSELDGEELSETNSSLRCPRKVKDYYTVVRNVKKAHQIQESGEFQEFNDDVDYILDALQDRNPTATRCLSAMSLASKCMEPAFRMHLRAHSTVAKFFKALKDAPSKASVALCTSCIMFVLTQDRLNMDLDRDSLELMLNLLEIDAGQVDPLEGKELEKNKLKVRELCEEMVRKGHAPHLQLDHITAAQLAMETLLSLTSKKAGEWFKEELRVLGGLDHIIQTVTVCTAVLTSPSDGISNWEWDKCRLDALKKVDRCLRVLENVTFQNEENQNYLMEFSNGRLVDGTLSLLMLLCREVAVFWPAGNNVSLGNLLSETLSNLMKVVMNLTHDSNDDSVGSKVYGNKSLTWNTTFVCLLQTSLCLPEDKSFDVMTLALGILINLVERSSSNRDRLMTVTVPANSEDEVGNKNVAIRALIDLFVRKEDSARLEEARTDEILDGKPDQTDAGASEPASNNTGKTQEDAMEETVKKLLHKAGRHMEDSMVAAYVALLLGYVVMKNTEYENQVKELLPEKKFTQMIVVLKKFYEFLKLTANAVTSTRGLKNTQMVIKFMETSDKVQTAGNFR